MEVDQILPVTEGEVEISMCDVDGSSSVVEDVIISDLKEDTMTTPVPIEEVADGQKLAIDGQELTNDGQELTSDGQASGQADSTVTDILQLASDSVHPLAADPHSQSESSVQRVYIVSQTSEGMVIQIAESDQQEEPSVAASSNGVVGDHVYTSRRDPAEADVTVTEEGEPCEAVNGVTEADSSDVRDDTGVTVNVVDDSSGDVSLADTESETAVPDIIACSSAIDSDVKTSPEEADEPTRDADELAGRMTRRRAHQETSPCQLAPKMKAYQKWREEPPLCDTTSDSPTADMWGFEQDDEPDAQTKAKKRASSEALWDAVVRKKNDKSSPAEPVQPPVCSEKKSADKKNPGVEIGRKVSPPERRIGIDWKAMRFSVQRGSDAHATTPPSAGRQQKKQDTVQDVRRREAAVTRREAQLRALDTELDLRASAMRTREARLSRLSAQLRAREAALETREKRLLCAELNAASRDRRQARKEAAKQSAANTTTVNADLRFTNIKESETEGNNLATESNLKADIKECTPTAGRKVIGTLEFIKDDSSSTSKRTSDQRPKSNRVRIQKNYPDFETKSPTKTATDLTKKSDGTNNGSVATKTQTLDKNSSRKRSISTANISDTDPKSSKNPPLSKITSAAKKSTSATRDGKKSQLKNSTSATRDNKKSQSKKSTSATRDGKKTQPKMLTSATRDLKKIQSKNSTSATRDGKKTPSKTSTSTTRGSKKTDSKKSAPVKGGGKATLGTKKQNNVKTSKPTVTKKNTKNAKKDTKSLNVKKILLGNKKKVVPVAKGTKRKQSVGDNKVNKRQKR